MAKASGKSSGKAVTPRGQATPTKGDKPKGQVGRPSHYDEDLAQAMLACIEEGEDITAACEMIGLPRRTYYQWLADLPEFRARCIRAREAGHEKRMETVRAKINSYEHQMEPKDFLKQWVSFEQWMAEKMAPKVYGQRKHVEMTGEIATPQSETVQIDVTMLDADQRAILKQALLRAKEQAEAVGEANRDEEEDDDD